MDLLMAGFRHNLFCHICSSSSHLSFFFLEAALLSGFASFLSSIALMHLVRLNVSETHFWVLEPSRVCFFPLSAAPPPLLSLFNYLFFIFIFFSSFFSWACKLVFPISLLAQTLTSTFLCFLMVWSKELTWEEGRGPCVTQPVLMLPLDHTGKCWGLRCLRDS